MESIETKLKVGYDLRVNLFLLHQLYLLLLSWIKGVADIIPEGCPVCIWGFQIKLYVCVWWLFVLISHLFSFCCFLIVSNSKCFIVGMCIKYQIWTISISSLLFDSHIVLAAEWSPVFPIYFATLAIHASFISLSHGISQTKMSQLSGRSEYFSWHSRVSCGKQAEHLRRLWRETQDAASCCSCKYGLVFKGVRFAF